MLILPAVGLLALLSAPACAQPTLRQGAILEPLTPDQQARLHNIDPPVMNVHYGINKLSHRPANCPSSFVPSVFHTHLTAFPAVTSFCSSFIASSTATVTETVTPTAYLLSNTVFTAPAPDPTPFNPTEEMSHHMREVDGDTVSSACSCLIGNGAALATATATATEAAKTLDARE